MRDVNGWLLAFSFLLGLLLTFAMMIRRVTREVPVNGAGPERTVPAKASAATMPLAGAVEKVEKGEKGENAARDIVVKADDILEKDPYGTGSVRVSARTVAPVGYTIKGDKDTGLFFSPDSPQYAAIEAEVWFANEESAAKAGFLRWDGTGVEKPAATVISEQQAPVGDASLVVVESGSGEVDSALRIVYGTEDEEPRRG
jgi:uncharacterized membrane protein ArfC